MTKKELEIYQNGIIEGMKHKRSSPETRDSLKVISKAIRSLQVQNSEQNERMARIETLLKTLVKGIDRRDKVCSLHSEKTEIKTKELKNHLENLCKKKADKWIEKVVYALIISTLLSLADNIINLI